MNIKPERQKSIQFKAVNQTKIVAHAFIYTLSTQTQPLKNGPV